MSKCCIFIADVELIDVSAVGSKFMWSCLRGKTMMLKQNWLKPCPLGFDDNKLFKEQLGILTFVQVCRFIRLRTDEEKLEDFESEVHILALKITSEDYDSDGRSRL